VLTSSISDLKGQKFEIDVLRAELHRIRICTERDLANTVETTRAKFA
jgi:hypothetical protein